MFVKEPCEFITYSGAIKLSQIKVSQYTITGVDINDDSRRQLDKHDILIAYSVEAFPDGLSLEINDLVEAQQLEAIKNRGSRFNILDSLIQMALRYESRVKIATRGGHILEGVIEHFNKYEILMQIKGQTVIVYRHGLHPVSPNESMVFLNPDNALLRELSSIPQPQIADLFKN